MQVQSGQHYEPCLEVGAPLLFATAQSGASYPAETRTSLLGVTGNAGSFDTVT
jgi:hypothetical protein